MSNFEKRHSHLLPNLQATLEEYEDPISGARHIHLLTDQTDLAFLVAFPTLPDNDSGSPHILEHLALTGSKRFPVRAPFFSMLRRSTASFMNAMTYSDRTVYPFASTDRNDFFNLLDVYLDATFFPQLDYRNFLQEGWRYTLENGKLGYQGVVFNEMKGTLANPVNTLYYGLRAQLLKGTTYEVISGGDPLAIPNLSHQMLKDFHARHYHPSQAVFMSAGPLEAVDIQHRIADRVLSGDNNISPRLLPQLAHVSEPIQTTILVPSQQGRSDDYGVQVAWLLGEVSDPIVFYHAHLLQVGLLGDASAPLRKAMESAGYGRPSQMNGMDSSARQMLFHVGMGGLTKEKVASARALLQSTLEQVAEDGIQISTLQAALRDITYSQRDTATDGMPNVLDRMLQALPVVMLGGNVVDAFDSTAAMERLRDEIINPDFFKNLVRSLLDNPARLDAEIIPDPEYFQKRASIEQTRLENATAMLTADERERIANDNASLEALQNEPSDTSLLPRITPADVSRDPRALPSVPDPVDGKYVFSIGANGISYGRIQYDISFLPEDEWPWLKLYAELRAELGVSDMSFETAGAWRRSQVSQFGLSIDVALNVAGQLRLSLNYSANSLREEYANIASVLNTYAHQPRFDELERIKFLIERMVKRRLDNLAQESDRYAALAATSPLSELRRFEALTGGVEMITFSAHLQRLVASFDGLLEIAERLAKLHEWITAKTSTILCAGSGDDAQMLGSMFDKPSVSTEIKSIMAAPQLRLANSALHAPGQVNHCYIAWKVPDQLHQDAPSLAVVAELMTHQLLHQALREKGGAYGGSATYAESAGCFIMSSYRDPRLAGTYADFNATIASVLNTEFTSEQLQEAIICVIKKLDRPASPFDEVLTACAFERRGIDIEVRRRFRSGVLACTTMTLKAAVNLWLKSAKSSRSAGVGNITQNLDELEIINLMDLAGEAGQPVEE